MLDRHISLLLQCLQTTSTLLVLDNMESVLPPEFETDRKLPDNSTLIIGTKASVIAQANYYTVRIIPETKMQELASSPEVLGPPFVAPVISA